MAIFIPLLPRTDRVSGWLPAGKTSINGSFAKNCSYKAWKSIARPSGKIRAYRVEWIPRIIGVRCGTKVNAILSWPAITFSPWVISGKWRCPLTPYALKLSLASESNVGISALRPAPDVPDLQSAIKDWVSIKGCEWPFLGDNNGAKPNWTDVG